MRHLFRYILFLILVLIKLRLCTAEDKKIYSDITINNYNSFSKSSSPQAKANFDTGPSNGSILNYHYFPGLLHYLRGNYSAALVELGYCLDRPGYITVNPYGVYYLSYGHYIRGMIYLYQASGSGRYAKAQSDFEQAIRWDQGNHAAYLALARVHTEVGTTAQAIIVLQQLIALQPPANLALQAQKDLDSLNPERAKDTRSKHRAPDSQLPK